MIKCLKSSVMQKLDWTELEYCEFQFEQGLLYLETYIGEKDSKIMDSLSASSIFWSWWRNHWNIRDASFMDIISNVPTSRALYHYLHNGQDLANEITPNRIVLEESYTTMMHSLIKAETSK